MTTMNKEELMDIGFNKNEAIVYLSLIKFGKADAHQLIQDTKFHKNIVYENLYKLMEKGVYVFLVESRAKKPEIKKSVESQFKVDVVKVNTQAFPKKSKRIANTRKYTFTGGGKRATVYLKSGQTIALLSQKAEKSTKSKKENQKGE